MSEEIQEPEAEAAPMDRGASPIQSLSEDLLGRRPFAEALAAEVLSAPAERGYVMGLTGPWGCGKTSILNMTVDALGEDAIVVQFNPWMFSGTETLVASFFEEIGKQLEHRDSTLRGIATKLSDYGRLLSPLASLVGAAAAVNGALDVLDKLTAAPSIFEQRQTLKETLGAMSRRLIVIVDDVDRLRAQEVLDIVRLVSLVGDFPNTLYLLAFDRKRVEECLGEGDLARGRAYLEKIVQVTHDVPAARQPDISAIFVSDLDAMYAALPAGPLNTTDWQNVYTFIVRPLLLSPRSVRRLLDSLSMTMRLVGDEVAFADLVGIEAVRVLHPTMYAAIVSVADELSAQGQFGALGYQTSDNSVRSPISAMTDIDPVLAKDICRWLFPAALRHLENMHYGSEWEVRWRGQRKIANSSVFKFYMERQLPKGVVPARVIDEALASLGDGEKLRSLIEPLFANEILDLVERMNATLEETPFTTEELESDPARIALPVLLDLLPQLPEDNGMFELTGSMVLMRASLRLLKRIPNEETRQDVVREVLPVVQSLSARLILIMVAGHREGIGVGQIAPEVAKDFEDRLREELCDLTPTAFVAETRPLRLADFMAETAQGEEALVALVEDQDVMLSLLVGATGKTQARAMGAAAVDVTKVIAWNDLLELLGEEVLVRRVMELMKSLADGKLEIPNESREALELAADYASGNRPMTPFERAMRLQQGDQLASDSSPAPEQLP